MTLVLEIEYLSGVCFAAADSTGEAPDWPPQPDRIFSALVASWGARGENRNEAAALEWLERLPAPRLVASDANARSAPTVFVPPNDPRSDKQKTAKGVLPAWRSRQPRRFPAARPHESLVCLVWGDALPDPKTFAALEQLAWDTAYIGHSASLTRCRFLQDPTLPAQEGLQTPSKVIYEGRFAELCQLFATGRRPPPGEMQRRVPGSIPESENVFSAHWLLLEHVGGGMPDVRACSIVAKILRNALLDAYQKIGMGGRIPNTISGHDPDGSPTRAPHLAIVPLPFVGFPYADGHVMGMALVPPQGEAILEDESFRRALRMLAPLEEQQDRRILTLKPKAGTEQAKSFYLELSPILEPPVNKRSLDPQLYMGPARAFSTVTPIVLDRHLKQKGAARQHEIADQIVRACQNIGLPEPEIVVPDKHSAFVGASSAYPSAGAPPWMAWQLPRSLASRQLSHATLRFPEPVMGPVILGAGRFVGLGFCRPLGGEAPQ